MSNVDITYWRAFDDTGLVKDMVNGWSVYFGIKCYLFDDLMRFLSSFGYHGRQLSPSKRTILEMLTNKP